MTQPPTLDTSDWPEEARRLWERRQRAVWGVPELAQELRERILASGPIPFRDFMRAALYHPLHGFYASGRQRTGPTGDFVTSPTLHPGFGAALGELCLRLWRRAGEPPEWCVLEMGAGGGELARDLLTWAQARHQGGPDGFLPALRYRISEPFPALVERQHVGLAPWCFSPEVAPPGQPGMPSPSLTPPPVSGDAPLPTLGWLPPLAELPSGSVTGVLLSNELVDAFPVHRLRWRQSGLEEAHVGLSDAGFMEAWLPATPDALRAAEELRGHEPVGPAGVRPEGRPFELCPEAREWLGQCARVLRRGYILTLDYGAEALELYSDRFPQGTLLAYRGHGTADPYHAPGDQDLSAWVDFTALAAEGRRQVLWSAPLTTQRDLLLHLGWPPRGADDPAAGVPGALESLIAPGGLGSVRVLLQGKGVSPLKLIDR